MGKVTTADIANMAGVSRATVSYVLNQVKGKTISEETRIKVLEISKQLDYKPNPFAKGLKTKASKTIALILPNITDPSMPVLIKGIETVSNFNEFSLMIHDLDVKNKNKLEDIEMLCEKALDGIIFAYPDESDEEIIRHLIKNRKIPTVVIGSKLDGFPVNRVGVDSFASGEMLAEYLYESGHEKVAFICGKITKNRKQRMEGIKSIYRKFSIEPEFIFCGNTLNNRSLFFDTREYDMGFEATIEILNEAKPYTAIVGMNDMIAIGGINALKSRGVSIPKEVTVAAFGGYFVSEIIVPKLSVVAQPSFEIGKAAFEVLKSILDSERDNAIQDIIFKPRLIIRESSAVILKE